MTRRRWIPIVAPFALVVGFYIWARLERDRQLTAGMHPFHEDSFDDPHGEMDDPQAFFLDPPPMLPGVAWLPGQPVPRDRTMRGRKSPQHDVI